MPAHLLPHLSNSPNRVGGSPTGPRIQLETRIEAASDSKVDSQFRSLTRNTSIEELTRAGLTHNLRTISERDLKDWIKEALRKVITSTTQVGAAEHEWMLAATRRELAAIMIARQADDHAHADDADELAALTTERDDLTERLASTEAAGSSQIAALEDQLAVRVAEFETRLAAALAASVAEVSELRGARDAKKAKDVQLGITRDEAQRVAHEVMAELVATQARTVAEKAALTDRITAANGTNADLNRRRGEAERRADQAEATISAQTAEAAATATRAKASEQAGATQRAGSAAQLKDAEAIRARLIGELADARAATAAEQEQLATALRAAGVTNVAAEQRARLAAETLAAAERQLQRSAEELQAAAADRLDVEQDLSEVENARAALVSERDRLATALHDAEEERGGVDGRLRAVEGERDDARRAAAAATRRAAIAETAAERLAAVPPKVALPSEITALQEALIRARSVVTDRDGEPRENVGGDLVARKPGHWLTAWRDAKGRFKTARTVGDHWMNAGRIDGIEPAVDLACEPTILVHGDRVLAAWRDAAGHACLATLDHTGHLQTVPRDLGPARAAPGLSRGGGTSATFVVTTDIAGHVQLHEADGSAPLDLTAQLAAPPAAGAAAAWHWPLEGSRHVAYRDADGAVHEYLELKGRWFHAAIGERTGAVAAAADPIGYAPGDHEHVVYLGVDGHIHELCFDAIEWHHSDLTASAAAPAAAGRPAGAYVAGRHCVVFRGVDGLAHCLRLRKDWRHVVFSNLGAISEDPQLGTSGSEGAVSYRSADGQRRWARFSNPKSTAIADLPA